MPRYVPASRLYMPLRTLYTDTSPPFPFLPAHLIIIKTYINNADIFSMKRHADDMCLPALLVKDIDITSNILQPILLSAVYRSAETNLLKIRNICIITIKAWRWHSGNAAFTQPKCPFRNAKVPFSQCQSAVFVGSPSPYRGMAGAWQKFRLASPMKLVYQIPLPISLIPE